MLSHRDAAVLWDVLDDRPGTIHVTATTQRRPPVGVSLHRTGALPAADVASHHGIPVTRPARTLLDLAATAKPGDLERALTEARIRRMIRDDELRERMAGRRGARALAALLADGPNLTRSEAERRLLSLLARAQLPRPVANARVERHEVDALWPERKLIVEVDGYAYHSGRAAFERDRLRDAALQIAGYRVLRTTWRQLAERPEALVAQIAAALARDPGARGSDA